MRLFTERYVSLLVKLGLIRFSILLGIIMVSLAVIVQIIITLILSGSINTLEVIRSIFFGLLITPWIVYLLSMVVDSLEESRSTLTNMVRELTELRKRDQELNKQLEQRTVLLRSFIDASPDLIYYRNEQGMFFGCNKAMEELTGKSESDLLGLTPWQVYQEEVAKKVIETDEQVMNDHTSVNYDQWLAYPDGRECYFELRKVPLFNAEGGYLGLVGFGRDITERKHYEESLKKASEDKTTFISTISHELRTPLNGIVGLSRMLLDSSLTQDQQSHMKSIYATATTLGHIFNDIIDIDKFERHQLSLYPTPLELATFIEEVAGLASILASQKGLNFHLEMINDINETVCIDANRLRQVLWNLLSNAVKFTKEGSVILSISTEVIRSLNGSPEVSITIEVEDSGVGMPMSELDKIFTMYYQIKSGADNLHAVGTGIGLAVSQQILHLMDGDISVDSEEGFGSTFSLHLVVPLAEPLPLKESLLPITSTFALNIFMIEDIELNVTVAKALFENLGHQVTVAMTGQKALDTYDNDKFDVIFCDIHLPDMDGFQVVSNLKSRHTTLPPIYALTANTLKDQKEYIDQGMNGALGKPIDLIKMKKLLDEVVHAQQGSFNNVATKEAITSEKSMIFNGEHKERLDLDMLESYVDMAGVGILVESVDMLENKLPSYLQALNLYRKQRNDDEVVSEAHKMKGAFGSVGLLRLQLLANAIQTPDAPEWYRHVDQWIDELNDVYLDDVSLLKQWLQNREI
ncbi:aerobic respiration two-component sensor histidine kinase ArcB [Vibrio sp.]|nr:aerobic respiration two-component sensor histidine kinase ArcB [Vibrio sp.]